MLTPTTTGSRRLSVEPGSSSTFDISLRNDGAAPETVRLRVTGPGGPFSFVVPDTLTIPPGEEASVRIGFRAPRSSVPAAGDLAFQVMARSDVAGTTELPVADGTIEVQRFCSLSATIDPSEATSKSPKNEIVTSSTRANSACTTRRMSPCAAAWMPRVIQWLGTIWPRMKANWLSIHCSVSPLPRDRWAASTTVR